MSDPSSAGDIFRQATTQTIHTLAGDDTVSVVFVSQPHGLVGREIRLPDPGPDPDLQTRQSIRAQADSAALQLAYHDDSVHQQRLPQTKEGRAIYDLLEKARCEGIGSHQYQGVCQNIQQFQEQECHRKGYKRITDKSHVPLSDILSLLTRSAISGHPVPEIAEPVIDLWRPWLEQHLPDGLEKTFAKLAKNPENQTSFTSTVRQLLDQLDIEENDEASPIEEGDDPDMSTGGDDDQSNSSTDMPDQSDSETQMEQDETDIALGDAEQQEEKVCEAGADQDSLSEDGNQEERHSSDEAQSPNGLPPEPDPNSPPGYRVFTTEFDEIITASELCDAEELNKLRQRLDDQVKNLQGVVSRLGNRLQRKLQAKQQRSWHFDQEEGILDCARLARVVVNPTLSLSYKQESETEFRDTIVTLLIDNSGSMRGRPIGVAAMCADILSRTLERCNVKVEVLGFTTKNWKGGDAKAQWVKSGKPENPGRLNDLRHIIYKEADNPWRRAKTALGLMLREGILKENIDGEALIWAHQRLLTRPEQRRILMVISDGAPVDDGTQSANPSLFLENHLREVIGWIENTSPVELVAIGIGHDVTRYYQRAVTIHDAEQLGGVMMDELTDLFEQNNSKNRRKKRAG